MSERASRIILIGTLAGVIIGTLSGIYLGEAMQSVSWLGTIFLNGLKMMIVPLVMLSMISGITHIGDSKKLGGIGAKTILFYTVTTMIAVFIGIVLVNIIRPGIESGIDTSTLVIPDVVKGKEGNTFISVLKQVVLGAVSDNIFKSMVNLKILSLIVFSLLLGGVLISMGEKAKPVIELFDTLNQAILKMVNIILWFSPIGVFALIAAKIGSSPDFMVELTRLGKYCLTVILGLFIHGAIVLPIILTFFAKTSPLKYFRGMLTALSTAFATSSSSATLPVTIECVEENNKVPNESAGFVLPLGATINMDGTALYEAVAAIFIAQTYGIDLTIGEQIIIFLTSNLAAIGAAGIPQAGLVTMVLVLQSVGLPLEGIGTILAVDWFLDRWRTMINVWGDSVGAAVIAETKEVKEQIKRRVQ